MGLALEGHEVTEGLQRDQMETGRDCLRVQIDTQGPWLALGRGDSEGWERNIPPGPSE